MLLLDFWLVARSSSAADRFGEMSANFSGQASHTHNLAPPPPPPFSSARRLQCSCLGSRDSFPCSPHFPRLLLPPPSCSPLPSHALLSTLKALLSCGEARISRGPRCGGDGPCLLRAAAERDESQALLHTQRRSTPPHPPPPTPLHLVTSASPTSSTDPSPPSSTALSPLSRLKNRSAILCPCCFGVYSS